MSDVTNLLSLLVLYEMRALSENTLQLFSLSLASVIKETLAAETKFWNYGKTLTTVAENELFLFADLWFQLATGFQDVFE